MCTICAIFVKQLGRAMRSFSQGSDEELMAHSEDENENVDVAAKGVCRVIPKKVL